MHVRRWLELTKDFVSNHTIFVFDATAEIPAVAGQHDCCSLREGVVRAVGPVPLSAVGRRRKMRAELFL